MKIRLYALTLLCTVSACGSAPKEQLQLPSEAFNGRSSYALLWIKPCNEKILGGCEDDDGRTTEAKFVVHGSASQVDLKQQYEESVGLSASIARINAKAVVDKHFLQGLTTSLKNRQMDVVAVADAVHEGALRKSSSQRVLFEDVPLIGATQFPLQLESNTYNFAPVYERLGVDYLIVLELLRFSVEQHFGPTGQAAGNPQVVSAIRLYVHERASEQTLFDDYAYRVVLAKDGWDAPPLYESLEETLSNTLRQAIAAATSNLLQY